MQHDVVESVQPQLLEEGAVEFVLQSLQGQVDDLRGLILGLGGLLLLVWGGGALLEALPLVVFTQPYSHVLVGPQYALAVGSLFGSVFIPTAAALLVGLTALFSSRSKEATGFREEWRDLSVETGVTLPVHILERVGVWRAALRRNVETSVISGLCLPLLVMMASLSIDLFFYASLRSIGSVLALGLTAGAVAFACIQVGSILHANGTTLVIMGRLRGEVLTRSAGGSIEPGIGHVAKMNGTRSPVPERDMLRGVEEAFHSREHSAHRIALAESRLGVLLLGLSAALIIALVLVTITSIEFQDQSYGASGFRGFPAAGLPFVINIFIALVGVSVVVWAASLLVRWRLEEGQMAASTESQHGIALIRIDQTAGELDHARAVATRSRNVLVTVAVLVVAQSLFGFQYLPPFVLSNGLLWALDLMVLPFALAVVLWSAIRLDRIDSLRRDLRHWVDALSNLESAFWMRY